MTITAIVATDRLGTIGRDNDIPWYLPADLQFFKRSTLGHPVIMGRKTFRSIGRPLPKRTNIVLSRDPFFIANDILVAHSLEEALSLEVCQAAEEVFIIGGGQIYEAAMPYLDRVYLTLVDTSIPNGHAFFPQLAPQEWALSWEEAHPADEKNEWPYTFRRYDRISLNEPNHE